jgi:hypothetical protein
MEHRVSRGVRYEVARRRSARRLFHIQQSGLSPSPISPAGFGPERRPPRPLAGVRQWSHGRNRRGNRHSQFQAWALAGHMRARSSRRRHMGYQYWKPERHQPPADLVWPQRAGGHEWGDHGFRHCRGGSGSPPCQRRGCCDVRNAGPSADGNTGRFPGDGRGFEPWSPASGPLPLRRLQHGQRVERSPLRQGYRTNQRGSMAEQRRRELSRHGIGSRRRARHLVLGFTGLRAA